MKVRFRRFRLISIDTHLWSELTSRRICTTERTAKYSRRLASSAVWLQEQVDDPPESQCHEKGQKENDSSTKLVVPGVGSGGEQTHKDVQPDGLDQVQPIDVECGTDKPAPEDHRHESSEEDVDDDKEEVAGDVASLSSGVVAHGESLSSPGRNVRVL